jgi:PAS domain S-box-containing protein
LVHPDDREAWLAASERAEQTGVSDAEFRIVDPDGTVRWIHDRAYKVPGGEGRPEMWVGWSHDVTAAHDAMAALEQSEERYRRLLENLPVIVYVDSDAPGPESLYVSPNVEGILGYAPSDYEHNPGLWESSIHPADRERVLEIWRTAWVMGEPYTANYRFVRPDGGVVWVRDSSHLVRDEHGNRLAWQGVLIDTTAEREADKALRATEARWRALVEQLPAVVYEMGPDEERRTLYVSPHVEQILGYSIQEWLDQPDIWVELLHPDDRENELEAHDRHSETGEPWDREYRLIASDGREVWVRDQAVLVGEATESRWLGVMMDITDRHELQERLRLVAEDLEMRVLERTAELEEAGEMMSLEIGERRRVEAELREARERLRLLVEEIPAVVYAWELHGEEAPVRTYVSPRIEQLTGYTAREWIRGDFWTERLHPHDRDRVVSAASLSARTGAPFEIEYRILARDGSVVWISDRGSLLSRDEQGNPKTFQGVMMDVTAWRLAEEKADAAEERFRLLTEQGPEVVYLFGLDRSGPEPLVTVEYVSPQVADILGYPVNEMRSNPQIWFEIMHPDDRERIRLESQQHWADGTPWTIWYRMIRSDGAIIWLLDAGRTLSRDELGRPNRFQGILLEATEHLEEAERLRRAEADYRELAEQVPAIPWTEVVDTETGTSRYTFIGPQLKDVLGYEPAELIAEENHFPRMVHPEDRERVLARSRLAETSGYWEDEYRALARDGSVRWMHGVGRRMSPVEGAKQIWHGVTLDVTAWRSQAADLSTTRDEVSPSA